MMSRVLARSLNLQRRARAFQPAPAPEAERPAISPEQHRAIYENLRTARCVCGAEKTPRQSFCRSHYFALPIGLRRSLYDSDGYAETFLRACDYLKLPPPAPKKKEAA